MDFLQPGFAFSILQTPFIYNDTAYDDSSNNNDKFASAKLVCYPLERNEKVV